MIERRYKGPVAWFNSDDGEVPESGFYALDKKGQQLAQPLVRLIAVQHRHSDEHHYRKAKDDEHSPPIGNIVEFEAEAEGEAQVDAP